LGICLKQDPVDLAIKLETKSNDMPSAWCTFRRLADSNPLAFSRTCCPLNSEDLKEQSKELHRYKPVLFLTKAWHWLKNKTQQKLLHHKVVPQSPPVLELKKLRALNVFTEHAHELTFNADRSDQTDQNFDHDSLGNEQKNSPNPSGSL
jgi:hypothetical protein